MKKKIDVEIENEDIMYALKAVVSEIVNEKAITLIKENIKTILESKVRDVIENIVVDNVVNGEFRVSGAAFGNHVSDSYTINLDKFIKHQVKECLSDKTYIWDKDAKYPNRYMKSDFNGANTSLIELIVSDRIRRYVNKEYLPKVEECVEQYVLNINNVSDAIEASIRKVFVEKVKSTIK